MLNSCAAREMAVTLTQDVAGGARGGWQLAEGREYGNAGVAYCGRSGKWGYEGGTG